MGAITLFSQAFRDLSLPRATAWVLFRFLFLLLAASRTAPAQPTFFMENWATDSSPWFGLNARSPGKALSNQAAADAKDGKSLLLQVPADARTGPGGGAQAETGEKFLYGTYTARIKTVDCTGQPDAGVVTGFFTYFNDGSDGNGDGIADNSEIDFEWLCAEPQTIYLTLWTDYNDTRHKRVGRQINMATGAIKYTAYFESFGAGVPLSGPENQPAALSGIPGYNSASRYYDYGFLWSENRVTWWMSHPTTGERLVLWDYQGNASRIPSRPSYYMVNAWHSDTWSVDTRPTAIKPPSSPVSAYVDWMIYDRWPTVGVHGYGKSAVRMVSRKGMNRMGTTMGIRLPLEEGLIDLKGRKQKTPR